MSHTFSFPRRDNYLNSFWNIWFFDASSKTALDQNFKVLGNAAGVGQDVKDVKAFLVGTKENWLCIFDNADDPSLFVEEYIPSCSHGNVIITSRLKEIAALESPGCHIEFGDLDRQSAVTLLLSHAHEKDTNKSQDIAAGC